MKTIMRKFAGRGLGSLLRNAGWAKLGWLCLAGWMINVAQAQPVNNNFASALVITNATGVTNGSNVGATLEPCEISFIMGDDFADIDNSVWFAWTAPSNGMAEFDTAGSDFDTVLAVFTTTNGLCATNLSYVAENDDVTNGVQTSQVNFFVFAGNTYYISVNGNADTGFPFDSGNYELNWSLQPSPANDMFTNAFVIGGYSGTTNGSNVGATLEPCELTAIIGDDYADITNSVWFAWTAPVNGTAEFDTIGSGFNTVLAVFTTTNGLCSTNIAYVAENDDITNAVQTNSQVVFPAAAGTTYYISVNGNADAGFPYDQGDYVLNWNLTTIPSGTFRFAFPGNYYYYGYDNYLNNNTYSVSELDSSGERNPSVGWSVDGARITVTRPAPANGRVLVDYTVTGVPFTDTLTTNIYGTNIFVTIINTNGSTTQISSYFTNTVFNNLIEYYEGGNNAGGGILGGGYQYYEATGASTNYLVISNGATLFRTRPPGTIDPTVEDVPNFAYYTTSSVTNIILYPLVITLTNYYTVTNIYDLTNVTYVTNLAAVSTNYSVTNYPPVNTTPFTIINLAALAETNGVNITNETDITDYFIITGGRVGTNSVITAVLDAASTPAFTNSPIAYNTNATYQVVTNTVYFSYLFTTNALRVSTAGFTPTTNTLTFDDFQMSQDFYIPVFQSSTGGGGGGFGGGGFGGGGNGAGVPGLPNAAVITLSNPRLDPLESSDLQPPTLDPLYSTGMVSILSTTYADGDTIPAANSIFNWERSTFRTWSTEGSATVYVLRTGGSANQGVSVQYSTDYQNNHTFPLQPGSDYATPGATNGDFTTTAGTLNWAANDANPQSITIPIHNNNLVEFNEDILLTLYKPGKYGELGQVSTATLTILNALNNPAGAADRNWNSDYSINNSLPGTEAGSTVYAVAEQPDGSAILAGNFVSYDQNPYNRIVRVTSSGYTDTSFLVAPNSGANDFIAALALQPDGNIIIGGNFTAFNGNNRHYIARLNSDGTLDTTFNPGLGANGTVRAVALETNVQIDIFWHFGNQSAGGHRRRLHLGQRRRPQSCGAVELGRLRGHELSILASARTGR